MTNIIISKDRKGKLTGEEKLEKPLKRREKKQARWNESRFIRGSLNKRERESVSD